MITNKIQESFIHLFQINHGSLLEISSAYHIFIKAFKSEFPGIDGLQIK